MSSAASTAGMLHFVKSELNRLDILCVQSSKDDVLSFSSEEDALVPIEEDKPDVILEGGLRVPGGIYDRLFAYQQTGVQWLWELHCQKAGGIIGDEMGLGKTVQVVSFLGALHYSGLYKPSLVVCPVTLLRQWRREIHTW
jgi:DNA excision repair protein ERCC-6